MNLSITATKSVTRRTQYELRKAEERAHILEGLIIASDNIDEVIAIIRSSNNAEHARERLRRTLFGIIPEFKARAIVGKCVWSRSPGLRDQKTYVRDLADWWKTIGGLQGFLGKKERPGAILPKNGLLGDCPEKFRGMKAGLGTTFMAGGGRNFLEI